MSRPPCENCNCARRNQDPRSSTVNVPKDASTGKFAKPADEPRGRIVIGRATVTESATDDDD